MTRRSPLFLLVLALPTAVLVVHPATVAGQALPDSLIQQVRAGAARVIMPEDSVALDLVGTPTLPLVAVHLNGRGPFGFLIDLGSNVVIVRRNVVEAARGAVLVDRAGTDIVRFDELRLGSVRYELAVASAYDTLDVDGVIGYNLLRHTSFTLDYPGRRLVLHARALPSPDDETVFAYRTIDRLPYVMLRTEHDSLLVNLDTGAHEWLTIPPDLENRLRWSAPAEPGPTVSNNQTGVTRVRSGHTLDTLRLGRRLQWPSPLVYVNPDAETAWLGSSAMLHAVWTFDPANQRVEVVLPSPP